MSLKSFIWQRIIKLYIPLVFAVAVVVAPQSYFEALQKGVFNGDFWTFWTTQYFTFSWDERMIAPFPTYNHMWYVLYLFHYTLVLLQLIVFFNSQKGVHVLSRFENWLSSGTKIIWLPLAFYGLFYVAIDTHDVTHAFYNDWYAHVIYLFAVLMGLLFVRMPLVWQSFQRNRYLALCIGLLAYGCQLAVFFLPEAQLPFDSTLAWDISGLIIKWSWLALVIGFAKNYLNYTNRFLKYCNGIVYPFFILHQTITIVLGYFVIDWGLNGVTEYLLIVAGTFAFCGLITEFIIKKVNIFRLLFGLNKVAIPSKYLGTRNAPSALKEANS